ncbi:hypothetical protein MYX06_04355 [Patescibacteria group bacterium AH-259-L05]|nr:hypothetical protein [Patescibacteria group bacterium AH-259-L05]
MKNLLGVISVIILWAALISVASMIFFGEITVSTVLIIIVGVLVIGFVYKKLEKKGILNTFAYRIATAVFDLLLSALTWIVVQPMLHERALASTAYDAYATGILSGLLYVWAVYLIYHANKKVMTVRWQIKQRKLSVQSQSSTAS